MCAVYEKLCLSLLIFISIAKGKEHRMDLTFLIYSIVLLSPSAFVASVDILGGEPLLDTEPSFEKVISH